MFMATKTKTKNTLDSITEVTQQAGLVLMAAAVTLGMIEVPEHSGKIIVPNQPAMALAGQQEGGSDNALRREKEETHPHHVSYGVSQRTPGRTGRV